MKSSERASYEDAARKDWFPDFQFTERHIQGQMERAARRAEYFPVYYVEPLRGNEATVGFDLGSNPDRLETLERARDTGVMVATPPMTLVQETEEQFGILILKPVYKSGTPLDTVEQHRHNLKGFVAGVFRIGDLVEDSLKDLPYRGH